MSDLKPSIIQRAVQLANSGEFSSMKQIEDTLSREGYGGVHSHLAGLSTRTKLRSLMKAARADTL